MRTRIDITMKSLAQNSAAPRVEEPTGSARQHRSAAARLNGFAMSMGVQVLLFTISTCVLFVL